MGANLRLASASALLVALAACDAPTVPAAAPAYEPRLFNGDLGRMQLFHWPLGKTIRIYVDPAEGGEALRDHVSAGSKAWTEILYYREFSVTLASNPANADVIVHTQSAPLLVDFLDCVPPAGGAAGITSACPDLAGRNFQVLPLVAGGGGSVKMDVSIDPNDVTTSEEVRSLVTHELGHVFGIGGHSGEPTDLMFGAPTVLRPSARDARTLRYVLHEASELRL